MLEFLKSYGIWIFLVLMLGMHLVPMLRRGRGTGGGMGGCCGSGQEQKAVAVKKDGDEGTGKNASCH